MTTPRTSRHHAASRLRLVAALVAGLLTAGCLLPISADPEWRLTFQGRVGQAGSAAAVPGARVEVWVERTEPVPNVPAFAKGETDARGAFVLSGTFRSPGVSPDVVVRVTPPAGSGLQAGIFSGHVSELFAIEYADREYTYTGELTLQPER
jgi:hypothetical protein